MKPEMSPMEFVEYMFEGTGLNLYPQQVALLKAQYGEALSDWEAQVVEKAEAMCEDRPPLTARAERYIGLMAHIALYGSEDGTEIQEEGLEGRISTFHEYVKKLCMKTGPNLQTGT